MELLERRYRDENALLAAVSRGDYDAAVRHLGRFSIKFHAPHRRAAAGRQNMLIVVNTLLRKAAESGGVHPVYIDQLSGALAVKIERVADTVEANRLGLEMLRRYCRLVRNDAHSGCSQAVQKTLSYISLHLSGELSLRSIAAALGFSATYLSAQFSRERGETLTAYIHTLRLQTARRLLDETDLPVAEVAARVGMVDVAYFSRLFKKKYGLSPLRYRARPAEG
ncbi:MAG: helix-turn-helix transcriptional regulator [Ruthenibacterium lactatiformans]